MCLFPPSSVVTVFCDMCSDWDFLEPQSFSFSEKRAHCCTGTQEEMRYEDSPVKAHPLSIRRMPPPTPLQKSYSSCEGEQEYHEVENLIRRAREKALWRQNSSSSSNERQWQVGLEEQRVAWSSSERKVMGAVQDYLGKKVPTSKWT